MTGWTPCGYSRITTGRVATPTAGQLLAELRDVRAGYYRITGDCSSELSTLATNMVLMVGSRRIGIVSSYNSRFEVFCPIADGENIQVFAVAQDNPSGVVYHVDNLTATPLRME